MRTTAAVLLAAALGPAAAPAGAQSGGASATPTPSVAAISCVSGCAGPSYARPGAGIRLAGRNLSDVTKVTFLGRKRRGDEVVATPVKTSKRRVSVTVPAGARRGRVVVVTDDGTSSAPSAVKLRIERIELHAVPADSGPGIEIGIAGRKLYVDGERRPTVAYVLHDDAPVHAVVQLLRVSDGAVITQWDQGNVPPGELRTVSWDGTVGGVEQPDGRYAFAIVAQDDSGAMARSAQAGPDAAASPDSFLLLGHKFPIRGKHQFGEGAAAFGGGRGHQGQDVFARCGTPLVAARGGTVKMKRYQSRAGNYVVIDTEGSDVDMAYMHLRSPALVDQRDRVRTGQLIGYVGDTGRANGCHLHFEEWSGPGWYSGGSAFDPLPDLQAWDALS